MQHNLSCNWFYWLTIISHLQIWLFFLSTEDACQLCSTSLQPRVSQTRIPRKRPLWQRASIVRLSENEQRWSRWFSTFIWDQRDTCQVYTESPRAKQDEILRRRSKAQKPVNRISLNQLLKSCHMHIFFWNIQQTFHQHHLQWLQQK